MKKESLVTSMAKLVMAVSLIVCIGALLGVAGYLAKNKEVQKTAVKKSVDAIDKDLTAESLKNAEYNSIFWKNETIKLKDGSYTREYPDSASVGYLGIFDDKISFGDLNGNGEKDAVIILDSSFGGTGHFYELVAVVNENGESSQISSEYLGDRSIINSLEINDGKIIIDIIIHGPGDGGCCPTLKKIFKYELQNDILIKIEKYHGSLPIDISSWKTYQNEKYGFEMKYPEYLMTREVNNSKDGIGVHLCVIPEWLKENSPNSRFDMDWTKECWGDFVLVVRLNNENLSLEEFFGKIIDFDDLQFDVVNTENRITVFELSEKQSDKYYEKFGELGTGLEYSYWFIEYQNYIFSIGHGQDGFLDINKKEMAFQILSSFKFIEK